MVKYSGHFPILPVSDTRALALRAVPLALGWVEGASNYLARYKTWRVSGQAFGLDPSAANVHLHLDRLDDIQSHSRVNEWIENYRMIAETLRDTEHVFVRASRDEALAARNWMHCWGQFIPAWAQPSAYVCANFATHASTGRDERFGLARPSE